MSRFRLIAALGLLACGGIAALQFIGHSRGGPQPAWRVRSLDRRCRGGCVAVKAPVPVAHYLLEILTGGPSAAQVASGSLVTTADGGAMTFTRTSITECMGNGGQVAFLDAGQPCVEPTGIAVRPAVTNLLTYTDTYNSAHWATTAATLTANSAVAPDGTMTAATLTDNATNSLHSVLHDRYNAVGANWYTFSVWARKGTARYMDINSGSYGYDTIFDLSNAQIAVNGGAFTMNSNATAMVERGDGGWNRYSIKTNDDVGNGQVNIFMGNTPAATVSGYVGDGGTLFIAYPMQYAAQELRPYIPNPKASGTSARTQDAFNHANPLGNSDTTWCVRELVTPDGNPWDQGTTRGLWQIGTTNGAANTASLSVNSSAVPIFTVVDATATAKTCTATTSIWSGSRVLRACDAAGTLSLSMDNTPLTCTMTGTGTGQITTQPATMYFGTLGASTPLAGTLSDICVDNTPTGCPIAPALRTTYVPKTLAAIGDSLTAPGPVNVTYWPSLLATAVPSWTITNYGAGSTTITDFTTTWHSTAGPVRTWQLVTMEGGINDAILVSSNNSLPYFYKKLWDEIDASGAQVVPFRESPWANSPSWNVSEQTRFDALQTYISGWCTSTGHTCVDFYNSALSDGGTPPTLSCAYDYDFDGSGNVCAGATANGVHINQAGQTYKEVTIKATLGL